LPVRPPLAPGTRPRTRPVGHGLGRAHRQGLRHQDWCRPVGDGHHGQALHRGARAGARPCGDRVRTVRSDPGRRPRDIDLRSRDESGLLLGHGARTQPPPAGLHPPGGPPSAQARPLAARHTGRAALPSATFPLVLPAVRQIPEPLGAAQPTAIPRRAQPVLSTTFSAASWQSSNVTRSPEPKATHDSWECLGAEAVRSLLTVPMG
jgi:hypothetical protein